MGVQCAMISSKSQSNKHSLKIDNFDIQLRNCQQKLHFQLRIENLRMSISSKVETQIYKKQMVGRINFQLEDKFNIDFPFNKFILHESYIQSYQKYFYQFDIKAQQLQTKKIIITIEDNQKNKLGNLDMKLHHICTGPYHQDHLLKELKTRLIFDLHLSQSINIKAKVQHFTLELQDQKDLNNYGYCLALLTSIDDNIIESEPQFYHSNKTFNSLSVTANIPTCTIKNTNLRIVILRKKQLKQSNNQNQNVEIISTIFLPYEIIQGNCYTILNNKINELQKRITKHKIELKIDNKIIIGYIKFEIELINSKKYVEQMQGLILSQNGITTLSPQKIQNNNYCFLNKTQQLKYIQNIITDFKKIKNYKQSQLKNKILEIKNMIKKQTNSLIQSKQKLYEIQYKLIQILIYLINLIKQNQDILNQLIWNTINIIIHKQQLSIRYFNNLENCKEKKNLFQKFYKFICLSISKVIHSTVTGISFQELVCIQQFMAFAYFRFPWLQDQIIKVLLKPSDPPVSNEKLISFGASKACKSPSKAYVYDWQVSIYNFIKNETEFKKCLLQLQATAKFSPDWALMLFKRQDGDLFYGFLIQLWTQGQLLLKNHGKIMWQYFPNYGQLLSIFLGQMNNNRIINYSPQFKKCSIKLLSNQKLLNSFLMLIFPKTCLYQTFCVLKCLDLIKSYFEVIVQQNKKLPSDFNYFYFYTGIKCIFQSNHSYLLVKTLTIVYNYYNIFSLQFKQTLNNFILGKHFFNLFLHWCLNVRKIYHYLLEFRILKLQIQQNPQQQQQQQQQNHNTNNTNSNNRSNMCYQNIQLRHQFQQLLQQMKQLNILQQSQSNNIITNTITNQYYLKMKQKQQNKYKKKQNNNKKNKSQQICFMITSCFEFNQKHNNNNNMSNFSSSQDINIDLHRRKWSTNQQQNNNITPNTVSYNSKKYIPYSLKQYNQVKKDKQPHKKVAQMSKQLQYVID